MKKLHIIILLFIGSLSAQSQTVQDLFQPSDVKITYLGIDYAHVKLIGDFTEFVDAGRKNEMEIRDEYFPRWNMVVVNEREKYDIAGMLRKSQIFYDIDMIAAHNAQAGLEGMISYNTAKFSEEDIRNFVWQYNLEGKEGIGVVFIAESLNKSAVEAIFHFVAINMNTGDILFHRRLRGVPKGFGLRNYWINPLYRIIQDVKIYYYHEWQLSVKPEGSGV